MASQYSQRQRPPRQYGRQNATSTASTGGRLLGSGSSSERAAVGALTNLAAGVRGAAPMLPTNNSQQDDDDYDEFLQEETDKKISSYRKKMRSLKLASEKTRPKHSWFPLTIEVA
jgi:hypothetical protein